MVFTVNVYYRTFFIIEKDKERKTFLIFEKRKQIDRDTILSSTIFIKFNLNDSGFDTLSSLAYFHSSANCNLW